VCVCVCVCVRVFVVVVVVVVVGGGVVFGVQSVGSESRKNAWFGKLLQKINHRSVFS